MGHASALVVSILLFCWPVGPVAAGSDLEITAVEPAPRFLTASINTPIVIHFDRPVLPGSVSSDSVSLQVMFLQRLSCRRM